MRPSHARGIIFRQPSTVVSHHRRFAVYRAVMWGVVCASRGATGAVLGSATGVVVEATGAVLGEVTWAVLDEAPLAVLGSDGACAGGGADVGARDLVSEVRSLAMSFGGFICSDVGAGDDARDGVGEEVSEVRRPRSLMVSFTGFTGSGAGMVMLDCCESMGPFDSSDELSVPSGVESESKSGRGERRFRARRCWSSSSPSTLGLGRFFEKVAGTTLTSGGPVWGPAMLRTDE
jgi:hypothetical protein